jgi:hypothetical protein
MAILDALGVMAVASLLAVPIGYVIWLRWLGGSEVIARRRDRRALAMAAQRTAEETDEDNVVVLADVLRRNLKAVPQSSSRE